MKPYNAKSGKWGFWTRALACAISASMFFALASCALLGEDARREPSVPKIEEPDRNGFDIEGGMPSGASEYYEGAMFASEAPWDEGFEGFNTEEYKGIKEFGFANTLTNPLSTFSADVDTASYCNLRRMVRDGYSTDDIPSGAVRIEEMLNYFSYDYALPVGNDLFGTTVRVGDCPWNPYTKLLVMGFATEPARHVDQAGSNLVFLVDVSGSMDSADKLGLLQDAFAMLVEGLGAQDRVSIVTYASGEEVVLEGAYGDQKEEILRAIGSLRADGATNGEAGLKMAYRLARENYIEGGVNRIVLASDGDLNVGMTDESSLEEFVASQRDTGVYLSVLGFGSGNYKDNKMETLADNGNGQYHYIDCVDEAQRVFGESLAANLLPLADDVKLQVEFNPAQVKGYRLVGYENRSLADEDFADDAKDAGEVGPGHQFTVVYELALSGSEQEVFQPDLKYAGQVEQAASSGEWLSCSVRYRLAGAEIYREQSFTVGSEDYSADPGRDWRFAAAVAMSGMVLRGSEYANGADLSDVLALLDAGEEDLRRREFASMLHTLTRRYG